MTEPTSPPPPEATPLPPTAAPASALPSPARRAPEPARPLLSGAFITLGAPDTAVCGPDGCDLP